MPVCGSAEVGGGGIAGVLDSAFKLGASGAVEVGSSTPSQPDRPAWRGFSCSDCLFRSVFRRLRLPPLGSSSGLEVIVIGVPDSPTAYGNGVWTVRLGPNEVTAGEGMFDGRLPFSAGAPGAFSWDGVGWDEMEKSKTKSERRGRLNQAGSRPYLSEKKGELPAAFRLDP